MRPASSAPPSCSASSPVSERGSGGKNLLEVAVRLWIFEMRRAPWEDVQAAAKRAGDLLASKEGIETASAFNPLARDLAALAFAPGPDFPGWTARLEEGLDRTHRPIKFEATDDDVPSFHRGAYPGRVLYGAPVISDQKIRELYLKHVGGIDAERAAGADEARFVLLELHALGTNGHAYATLGAREGSLQHELVLDTIEPFPPFAEALEATVRAAPALAPGVVVPCVIPETPFTALLCLPFDDAEGSFSLSKAGAPSYAFRLAPLTPAEQALAEREPGRVTGLLRAAYAFTADRYRACLVDVPKPPPAARTEVALQRRQVRAGLLALQADVRRQHGARGPAAMSNMGHGRRDDGRLSPGAHLGLIAWAEEMIRDVLRPYVRHPAMVTYLFGEFIYVTFATHPDAVRMLERALDPRNLPRPAPLDARRQAAASRNVTEALAIAISRFHPGESEAAILARVQPAIRDALSTFDPADEIPLENHVWATLLPVMYEGLADLRLPSTRGMPKVFRRTAQNEAMLEYEPDPRPPLLRLKDIGARLATELVTAYAAGLRGQLPA